MNVDPPATSARPYWSSCSLSPVPGAVFGERTGQAAPIVMSIVTPALGRLVNAASRFSRCSAVAHFAVENAISTRLNPASAM